MLSDHNILSRGEKWKTLRADQALPVLAKAKKRWGKGHVKTRLLDGKKQVRLMELDEVRELLEEPGKFIMIEGLEMTTDPSGYSVHTNPMNISALIDVEKIAIARFKRSWLCTNRSFIATKMRRVIQFSGKPTTLTLGSLSQESSWLPPAVLKAWRS